MVRHLLLRQVTAALLCASITACASGGYRVQSPSAPRPDAALLAEYVQKLPLGEPVRVERATGPSIRGTLMKATARSVVVQPRTRIPVAPIEVPLAEVTRLTPDARRGASLAKAIGAGVAAGAAGALAVFFILVGIYAD